MTLDPEKVRRDMEVGTGGDWVVRNCRVLSVTQHYDFLEPWEETTHVCRVVVEADRPRIARLPQLEADWLAQRERVKELEAALKGATVSLISTLSMLEAGGRAGMPSDTIYRMAVEDVERIIAQSKATLNQTGERGQ